MALNGPGGSVPTVRPRSRRRLRGIGFGLEFVADAKICCIHSERYYHIPHSLAARALHPPPAGWHNGMSNRQRWPITSPLTSTARSGANLSGSRGGRAASGGSPWPCGSKPQRKPWTAIPQLTVHREPLPLHPGILVLCLHETEHGEHG